MAPNYYPEGSHTWCPVCLTEVKNVDKHLKAVHHVTPLSQEQKILCALGRDRIALGGELVRCPLFRETGCTREIENPCHHLKTSHGPITKERMKEVLRPIRYKKAMGQLKELRRSKRETMMTNLDEIYEEDEPASGFPAPTKCTNHQCKLERKQIKTLQRINSLLRLELSKLQELQVQTFGTNVII